MSEIFYTQVDRNLAAELDTRALAGRTRDNKSIDYMVGKVANVQITAYEGNGTTTNALFTLGGSTVRGSSYQPSGVDGFLTTGATRTLREVSWVAEGTGPNANFVPTLKDAVRQNTNNRVPPYISSANISVGDHSMGLLNTATIVIEVPNPERDLDYVDEIFFRAGRYVKMEFEYPKSAVITQLQLQPTTIPNAEKLEALYGKDIDITAKTREISRLNAVAFEGLITSFTFNYNTDYTVQATITMRGTSNVYTDVSMFINSSATAAAGSNTSPVPNPIATPEAYTATITQKAADAGKPADKSFYAKLLDEIDTKYNADIANNITNDERKLLLQGYSLNQLQGTDDRWYLIGNAWSQKDKPDPNAQKTFSKYITLGYLIDFINRVLAPKLETAVANPKIICSNLICYSNYYEYICSADPENVLLLPKDTDRGTTEQYGDKTYFENTRNANWPGYQGREVAYPACIFIQLKKIENILDNLTAAGSFKISDFLASISETIHKATAGAINLNLITHPKNDLLLAYYDANFLGTPGSTDDVKPYHIPMTAAYPAGTADGSIGSIVHDFKLSAKIPDSVSTLSYVLNQNPDQISEDQIAPYLNYMYNSSDPEKIKTADAIYKKQYAKYLDEYNKIRADFGLSMTDTTKQSKLEEALLKYLQYPKPELKQSQQITAPIFPFEAEFTIDGVNGFRYGDVVTFDVLPYRYRINTVFSIIGVEHDVTQDGQWTTVCRCIMRPRLGK
jgi:hypothetical protein